jgi:hypothetical protein
MSRFFSRLLQQHQREQQQQHQNNEPALPLGVQCSGVEQQQQLHRQEQQQINEQLASVGNLAREVLDYDDYDYGSDDSDFGDDDDGFELFSGQQPAAAAGLEEPMDGVRDEVDDTEADNRVLSRQLRELETAGTPRPTIGELFDWAVDDDHGGVEEIDDRVPADPRERTEVVRNLFKYCCNYSTKPALVRSIAQFNQRPHDRVSVQTFVRYFRRHDDLWDVLGDVPGANGNDIDIRSVSFTTLDIEYTSPSFLCMFGCWWFQTFSMFFCVTDRLAIVDIDVLRLSCFTVSLALVALVITIAY